MWRNDSPKTEVVSNTADRPSNPDDAIVCNFFNFVKSATIIVWQQKNQKCYCSVFLVAFIGIFAGWITLPMDFGKFSPWTIQHDPLFTSLLDQMVLEKLPLPIRFCRRSQSAESF